MADVVINTDNKNSKELAAQGIRAYVLQDYGTAIAALSKASELLVNEHGDDLHDSLGDIYLYYGKALLGLSREQSEALGDAIPKNEGESDDDDEEGEAAEMEGGDSIDAENSKMEEESKNGTGDEPSGSTENVEDEDEPTDLQVAWEVLECAKKIFLKHGDEGKRNLAETLIVLGEISLESENFQAAINDMKEGLSIQKELFGKDSRAVAESFYKLGMAYSTDSQIDEAIESFNGSLEYLRNRIAHLEKVEDKNNDIDEEIKEIKNLMPEIEEKVNDMKMYKDEAVKKIVSTVTEAQSKSSPEASSSKPVNDISHLIKRKRTPDEKEDAEANPSKKPSV